MPVIETDLLEPNKVLPQNRQIYNGLDCCVTFEVWQALKGLSNRDPLIYTFERALQAPALDMMLRGFRIDPTERRAGVALLTGLLEKLDSILQQYAYAVWDKPLNPRSPAQLSKFFYEWMGLPEQHAITKGVRRVSTNRECLEKLELYFHARPIVATILKTRDLAKTLSVLTTEIDSDNRLRTSYNIAGTETGRWSSSKNAFGTGTNLQNIQRDTEDQLVSLRRIFVADKGKKLLGIDLEQAESREVGWQSGILFNDWAYLNACYEGDLHTLVCRYGWPHLEWTGDPKRDRAVAERIAYRNNTYRDLAKKLGHGSNYYGKAFTMARHARIPVKIAQDFQDRYFAAFPGIPKWHQWTAQQLQTTMALTTPFGRTRHFFGRHNDDSTLREAIAYVPQSSTGDRMNLGMLRIWQHMRKRVDLLAQVHDAIYFQFNERDDEQALATQALALINIPITCGEHTLIVPGEAKVGWNWASFSPSNPDGMKKLGAGDNRKRTTLLERIM